MKKIAITGGTGHLGNVIIKQLLETHKENIHIKALIHNPEHTHSVKDLDIEYVYGDVTNIDSLRKLCEGVKILYHCAAYISIVHYEDKKLYNTNFIGTKNILQVCKENNIQLIHISSIEAVGKKHANVHTEDDGFNPNHTLIKYGLSKSLASIEVSNAVARDNLHATIICPVGISGPFDYGTSKVGKMVQDYIHKKLPAYPSTGGFCFTDVRDVAHAAIKSSTDGVNGRHYIVSGGYSEISNMMSILHEVSDIKPPKMHIPLFLIGLLAPFIEFLGKISAHDPIFSSGSVNVLKSQLHVKSLYTEKDLGITPRSIKESLQDQVAWYRNEKVDIF